jgi:feruloyl esterase
MARLHRHRRLAGLAWLAFAGASQAADPCAPLAAMGNPALRIDSARLAAADGALPAHCIVQGMVETRTGFELRLPLDWNARLLFQGGGGLDGSVKPALGALPLAGARELPGALARGYAVVSMDGGHQGDGAAFASDDQAWADFAYASAPRVTRAARLLAQRFYGRPPAHSYFMGCSNGGREAMMAAQRDPAAFDGVVAGNPGFNLAGSALEEVWETAVLAEASPVIAQAFSDAELKLVADAVLARCDAADGLADGLVFDRGCRFNPQVLQCEPGQAAERCLPAPRVELLRKLFGGARAASGEALYASWPYDPGIAAPAWRRQKLGSATGPQPDSGNAVRGAQAWYEVMLRRPQPRRIEPSGTVAAAAGAARASAQLINADATDMGAFAARGGKMIVYQGMADPVFSADDLVGWYRRASAATPAAAPWMRLFLSPGMGHCGGGPGLDNFDPLVAIEAWVERGQAPERLVARGAAFPGVERPLCAFPASAVYDGSGAPQLAASFRCELPRGEQP